MFAPIPLLFAEGLMLLVWLLSLVRRDAGVIDVFWGPGFVLLAGVELAAGFRSPRAWIVFGALALWGLRLAAHIAWRARGADEDYRYRAMRERHGNRFPLVSLFTVFLLQGFLIWLLSAPLRVAMRAEAPLGAWDAIGGLVFAVGFLVEAIADLQLARFRGDPGNRGRVLDRGLWGWSRHPNYFGEAVLWWGLYAFAAGVPGGGWTVFSPVLMTLLLLRVSGVTLLEPRLRETKPAYADYVERTSAFVPWPPKSG